MIGLNEASETTLPGMISTLAVTVHSLGWEKLGIGLS